MDGDKAELLHHVVPNYIPGMPYPHADYYFSLRFIEDLASLRDAMTTRAWQECLVNSRILDFLLEHPSNTSVDRHLLALGGNWIEILLRLTNQELRASNHQLHGHPPHTFAQLHFLVFKLHSEVDGFHKTEIPPLTSEFRILLRGVGQARCMLVELARNGFSAWIDNIHVDPRFFEGMVLGFKFNFTFDRRTAVVGWSEMRSGYPDLRHTRKLGLVFADLLPEEPPEQEEDDPDSFTAEDQARVDLWLQGVADDGGHGGKIRLVGGFLAEREWR
ncbi:hypothetical protein M426DRAFT_11016 [Hypoxylon sp. CI-4A]|nr:hypothetical protein M426DRAFT_11016 [Hypoxylon sp. CI-4A]